MNFFHTMNIKAIVVGAHLIWYLDLMVMCTIIMIIICRYIYAKLILDKSCHDDDVQQILLN
jgi:hypothetical protein